MDKVNDVGINASVLSELVRNDIFVPNSFIISASSFWNYLDEADIKMRILEILNNINILEEEDLKNKSQQIQELIRKAETPWELDADIIHAYRTLSQKSGLDREVIVIHSDIASGNTQKIEEWHETLLNIKNERELLKKVKECWKSFFSVNSISYRIKNELKHEDTGIALTIQKMINSNISGNILTSYTTNHQTIIEVMYGLGSVVGDQDIMPDKYIVSKESNIEDKIIGKQSLKYCLNDEGNTIKVNIPDELVSKQKIFDEDIIKLAEIGKKIEGVFNRSQDIKWSIANQEIFIVSSKPIKRIVSEIEETVVEKIEGIVDEKIEETIDDKIEEKVVDDEIPLDTKKQVEDYFPITATEIFININDPEIIDKYSNLSIQGVLVDQKYIITNYIKNHPLDLIENNESEKFTNIITEKISYIAKTLNPKKVILKLSNLRTDVYRNLINGEKLEQVENDPKLGMQGCSKYLSKEFEGVFRLEIQAIRKIIDEYEIKNLSVTVPFVRTIMDTKKVIEIMKEEGLERNRDFNIFMNIEVPSNVILAKEFIKYYDGFTLDIKNLTQFIMAADFDSDLLKEKGYCDIRDEAIKKVVEYIVKKTHKKDSPVLIYGDNLIIYPEFIEYLIRIGMNGICFNPEHIEEGIRLIASLEKKILLEKLRD